MFPNQKVKILSFISVCLSAVERSDATVHQLLFFTMNDIFQIMHDESLVVICEK